MSEQTAVVAPVAESTPATIPIGSLNDVASYREARDKGLHEVPNPAATPKVETPTPEPKGEPTAEQTAQAEAEANSTTPDADLSEAGRKLRANRSDARKQKIQHEINELTRQREAIRRELEAARQPQTQTPQPPAAPQTTQTGKPSEDEIGTTYATYADYVEALTDWKLEQKLTATAAARQQAEADRASAQVLETFQQKAAEARTTHADYDAVVDTFIDTYDQHPLSRVISEALMTSDLGPALTYHLATHPDVAKKVFGGSPALALKEIGKLEGQLAQATPATKAAPPVTTAPAPVPAIGGGGSATGTKSPSEISDVATWRKVRADVIGDRRL